MREAGSGKCTLYRKAENDSHLPFQYMEIQRLAEELGRDIMYKVNQLYQGYRNEKSKYVLHRMKCNWENQKAKVAQMTEEENGGIL